MDSFFGFRVEDKGLMGFEREMNGSRRGVHLVVRVNNGTDNGGLHFCVAGNDAHVAAHNFHVRKFAFQSAVVV